MGYKNYQGKKTYKELEFVNKLKEFNEINGTKFTIAQFKNYVAARLEPFKNPAKTTDGLIDQMIKCNKAYESIINTASEAPRDVIVEDVFLYGDGSLAERVMQFANDAVYYLSDYYEVTHLGEEADGNKYNSFNITSRSISKSGDSYLTNYKPDTSNIAEAEKAEYENMMKSEYYKMKDFIESQPINFVSSSLPKDKRPTQSRVIGHNKNCFMFDTQVYADIFKNAIKGEDNYGKFRETETFKRELNADNLYHVYNIMDAVDQTRSEQYRMYMLNKNDESRENYLSTVIPALQVLIEKRRSMTRWNPFNWVKMSRATDKINSLKRNIAHDLRLSPAELDQKIEEYKNAPCQEVRDQLATMKTKMDDKISDLEAGEGRIERFEELDKQIQINNDSFEEKLYNDVEEIKNIEKTEVEEDEKEFDICTNVEREVI